MSGTTDKVAAVKLDGFTSAELTALSRRCLAVRKGVNAKSRAANSQKSAKRKADRIAYLKAELAKLG